MKAMENWIARFENSPQGIQLCLLLVPNGLCLLLGSLRQDLRKCSRYLIREIGIVLGIVQNACMYFSLYYDSLPSFKNHSSIVLFNCI